MNFVRIITLVVGYSAVTTELRTCEKFRHSWPLKLRTRYLDESTKQFNEIKCVYNDILYDDQNKITPFCHYYREECRRLIHLLRCYDRLQWCAEKRNISHLNLKQRYLKTRSKRTRSIWIQCKYLDSVAITMRFQWLVCK